MEGLINFFMQYGSYGWFYGGPMEQMVSQWAQMGVFTVLLPFVLVFAVVYAILDKIKLLNNRGVHVIIALVVAFFTIANPYVVSFFMPLFSNLGLGVAVLICVVILFGLAIKPETKTWTTIFTIIGIILLIVILARTPVLGYILPLASCDAQCQAIVVFLIVIVLAVIAALAWGKKEDSKIAILGAPGGGGG
ncbi:MAG: hypothetical protein QXP53_01455 [Candidatus Pacearchaeota archaeon]